MNFLKTFEAYKKYTIRLDDYSLRYLMDEAVENNQYSTISDILDSDYKFIVSSFERLLRSNSPNIKIMNMFINKGDKDLINKRPFAMIVLNQYLHLTTKFNIIKKLIEEGHDLFLKENGVDFFDALEYSSMNKKYKDKILFFIKEKYPEQYQRYLMKKDVNKYNL